MTHARSTGFASMLVLVGLGCPLPGGEPPDSIDSEGSTDGPTTTSTTSTTGIDPSETDSGTETVGATDAETDGATDDGETNGGCEGTCVGGTGTDSCPSDLAAGSTLIALFRAETDYESPNCDDYCYWERSALYTYDPATGTKSQLALSRYDVVPYALAIADDDSIVVAGENKPDPFEPGDGALLRYSAEGEVIWDLDLRGYEIADVEIVGEEIIALADPGVVGFALDDGSQSWTLDIPATALAVEPDGGFYVAGEQDTVRKYDPQQHQQWEAPYPVVDGETRQIVKLARDETGGVTSGAWVRDAATNRLIELRRLDADGVEAWSVRLDAALIMDDAEWDDAVFDLQPHPSGGAIMSGRSALDDGIALVAAFDAQGNQLWLETVNMRPGITEAFEQLAIMDGQVFAVGCSPASWLSSFPL